MGVLDDVRWRFDASRPARSSTVQPRDGVTVDDVTDAVAATVPDLQVLAQRIPS